MGLTEEIGRFAADARFGRLPAAAIPIVRAGFADCIAVLLAGNAEPPVGLLAGVHGFGNPLEAWLPTGRDTPAAADAALVGGAAAHVLDYDDTGLSGHPSAVLVPAILAEALATGASGEAMIAAYAVGYEIWAELARREPDPLYLRGWHPSTICGTIAAAGASASLRGLAADAARNAIGIAASLAGGVVANFGTMTKSFQLGRAAQSGLMATRYAEAGMTSGSDALEHRLGLLAAVSPEKRVDLADGPPLGEDWQIVAQGLNIKLYPLCYGTHRILDAMVDLCRDHPVPADRIARVDVALSEVSFQALRYTRPRNALEAKFSAQFAIAAVALAGRCGAAELEAAFLLRPDVQAFFGKVHATPIHERDPDQPLLAPWDQVILRLDDGRSLESRKVRYPRGHFRHGLDMEGLRTKFLDCVAPVHGSDAAGALLERIGRLETLAGAGELGLASLSGRP